MSDRFKPSGAGGLATVTTGFRPLQDNTGWDRQPLYRVVEVTRDGEGRLHKQGHVWHNDLEMLRRFGRAVAANTASHKVLIADAHGDIVEELPIAPPEARHSAWDTWGGMPLPPAPPMPVHRPKPAPVAALSPEPAAAPPVPVVQVAQETCSIPPAAKAPPRDIPKLPVDQAAEASPVPAHEATLP